MLAPNESVVVVLATRGAPLEGDALDALPETTVTWVRIEREGRVAGLAARVRHPPTPSRNSESGFSNGVRLGDGP
jgi:hypothetical protein